MLRYTRKKAKKEPAQASTNLQAKKRRSAAAVLASYAANARLLRQRILRILAPVPLRKPA